MKYISYASSGSAGLLQKAAVAVVAVAMAAAVVVFSSVILAVLAVATAVGLVFLWWKTRHVRRAMREMQASMARAQTSFEHGGDSRQGPISREEKFEGVIIEGEAVRVEEPVRPPRR